MSNRYHMTDILNYERITRRYCKMEYLDEELPDTMTLIDYAYKEKKI